MRPLAALILRPGGRPAALKVRASVGVESVAVTCTGVISTPTVDFSVAGAATVTLFPTVQVKPMLAATPSASVTVTVTA